MLYNFLQAKIHRARVTQTDLDYNGSISISPYLLEASGIREFQQVEIYNITNGSRFTTYAIKSEDDSGIIGVNGAAAHLTNIDDLVIICAYVQITPEEIEEHQPKVILVDQDNKVTSGV